MNTNILSVIMSVALWADILLTNQPSNKGTIAYCQLDAMRDELIKHLILNNNR